MYPYIEGLKEGTCIDVHSKLMIVDDDIVRIGSANIANRSMGLDTECDLTIACSRTRRSAQRDSPAARDAAGGASRQRSPRQVQQAIEQHGLGARGHHASCIMSNGRCSALEDVPQTAEALLNVASVADPERPVGLADLAKIFSADDAVEAAHPEAPGPAWGKIAMHRRRRSAVLTALWQFTPLSELFDARQHRCLGTRVRRSLVGAHRDDAGLHARQR